MVSSWLWEILAVYFLTKGLQFTISKKKFWRESWSVLGCGKFEAIMEKIRQREQEGRSSPLGKTHQKFFSTIWSFLFRHIAYSYFTGMKEIPLKIWVR